MTAEDEFRKVGEDVRELARALRAELRAARHQARERSGTYGSYGHGWWTGWSHPYGSNRPPWWAPPTSDERPPGDATDEARDTPYGGTPHRYGRWGGPASGYGGVAAPAWAPPISGPSRPARVRRERPPIRHRRDGSTLISILLVLVGLAWLGSQSRLLQISTETVLAVVLALIGAAMVLTARTDWGLSRRIWPVLIGAVVLAMLLVNTNATAIGDQLSSLQFGPQTQTLTAWSDAATTIDNFAGPVRVDASALRAAGTPVETMRITDVFGPIEVILPSNLQYRVHVSARTEFGPVRIGATRGSGHGFTVREADLGPPSASPALIIDITSKAGPVSVHESAQP